MSDKQELTRSEVARQRRAQRAKKELAQTSKRATKPVVTVSSRVAPRDASRVARKRVVQTSAVLILRLVCLRFICTSQISHPAFMPVGGLRLFPLSSCSVLRFISRCPCLISVFRMPPCLATIASPAKKSKSVTGVLGQSIFTVQPDEVETRLRMNYPELLSAQVNVYLPNHVYVTLTERQPVILWQQDEGYTWIDATGVAFRPRGLVAGLVPVQGLVTPPTGSAPLDDPFAPPPYMQKELVDAILALAPTCLLTQQWSLIAALGLGGPTAAAGNHSLARARRTCL